MSASLWFYVSPAVRAGVTDLERQSRERNCPSAPVFEWIKGLLNEATAANKVDRARRACLSPQLPPATALLCLRRFEQREPLVGMAGLPKGTCILSDTGVWPFDLQDSDGAVHWVIRRAQEQLSLQCLPEDSAAATFPRAGDVAGTRFGPFNNVGIVVDLQECNDLSPELARLSVPTREKWHRYLKRSGPVDIARFPPLNHTVGVMVGHEEFTDEVAMDVYGAFSCTVELSVLNDLLPAFDSTSAADCKRLPSFRGAVQLSPLNGATVLLIACCLLQAESAVHKLLDMDVTGMIILHDLAEYGLGWIMHERDMQGIVTRWLQCTDYYIGNPPPVPKLSLLLKTWMTRKCGLTIAGRMNTPMLRYREVEILAPSIDVGSDAKHSSIRSGIFCGSACGAAIALAVCQLSLDADGNTPAHVDEWVEKLIGTAQATTSNTLLTESAAEMCKGFLEKSLHGATSQDLKEFDQLRNEAMGERSSASGNGAGPWFDQHFYRAFFVSLTDGRIRDTGEGPLEWGNALRDETELRRRALIGVSCDHGSGNATADVTFRFLAVFAISLGAVVFLSSYSHLNPTSDIPLVTTQQELNMTMVKGISRLTQSVNVGPGLALKRGDLVYLLSDNLGSWCKVATKEGAIGVSATLRLC
ncbi:hypothetical protein A1Q2_05667 [Trichosporon asahii var. asahii CBS 8904]|uniref:SH3 domain-containing protein n=1 Tax=Trichosporon asahii var. asahii (strain CBS 8904) TaxID=1220162 RepID=K1WEG4_TRIAC|nr:hypothetical protein A1Q2_05667 [Trichosporon asahii var. asahii CBS 8904]